MKIVSKRKDTLLIMSKYPFAKEKILLVILLFGLMIRFPSIKIPLVDANAWRQTDTAAMARNFFEERFNILYPQVDWRGDSEGYVESEFPIYPYIIASLYKIFGVHDWLGRIMSLFFFILSVIYLCRLAQKVYNSDVALWASLVFIISPLNIHFSRVFMPTSMLVFCSIASIYYFLEWLDKNKWFDFGAAALATSMAVLIKIPSLYLGLPLLYLALKKHKKLIFFQWRIWLFGFIVLIPVFLWYWHAHQLFLTTELTFGLWGAGYSKFGDWSYWLSFRFYRIILSRLALDVLPFMGLLLAFIGIFLKAKRKNYVFQWWGIAFLFYIFIAAEGHQTHFYYQLPFVPVLSVFAGLGINYLWEKDLLKDTYLKNRFGSRPLVMLLIIIMLLSGLMRMKRYLRFDPNIIPFGKRIAQLTGEDALVIVGGWKRTGQLMVDYPPRNPINFYFSHRKGWEISLDEWSISLVDTLKKQGASYFVSYYPMGLDIKKEFAKEMRDKFILIEMSDRWFLFDLRGKN